MIDLRLAMIAEHYELEPQLNVLQEECAELIQAVSKYRRDGMKLESVPSGLIEEIADVEIMLEQTRILLGEHVNREIDRRKNDKINEAFQILNSWSEAESEGHDNDG